MASWVVALGAAAFGATRHLVIVSAVGSPSRLGTVRRNLELFPPDSWDCSVCTWHRQAHAALMEGADHSDAAGYLRRRCTIEFHLNWKWASLINATSRRDAAQGRAGDARRFVAVMLDDVRLSADEFDAGAMIRIATAHGLDRISPLVRGASFEMMRPSEEDNTRVRGGTEVRLTNWIESYVVLSTMEAWRCYVSMFADEVLHNDSDAVGYGYDFCYKALCGGRNSRLSVRQGLALTQRVDHLDLYANTTSSCSTTSCTISLARRSNTGRRLALGSNGNGPSYGLREKGHHQMKAITRWVFRTRGKRCAHMAPQPSENLYWTSYA